MTDEERKEFAEMKAELKEMSKHVGEISQGVKEMLKDLGDRRVDSEVLRTRIRALERATQELEHDYRDLNKRLNLYNQQNKDRIAANKAHLWKIAGALSAISGLGGAGIASIIFK